MLLSTDAAARPRSMPGILPIGLCNQVIACFSNLESAKVCWDAGVACLVFRPAPDHLRKKVDYSPVHLVQNASECIKELTECVDVKSMPKAITNCVLCQ